MTPSDAHESAWKRSPEHDQFSLEVFRFLKQMPFFTLRSVIYKQKFVENEALIQRKGGGIWFADLLWWGEGEENGLRSQLALVFELKPKIYSAGALIRQLRVQEMNTKSHDSRFGSPPKFMVIPVVPKGDPLLPVFAEMWNGSKPWTWNGEGLEVFKLPSLAGELPPSPQ